MNILAERLSQIPESATGWNDVDFAAHLLQNHHVAIVPGSACGRFAPKGK